MLTSYDWVYGISILTAVILSMVAGVIAITMFEKSGQRKHLAAWRPLIFALIFFAAEEIFGALKVFGIWNVPWITHVIPSFVLLFLIIALLRQTSITRGCEQ